VEIKEDDYNIEDDFHSKSLNYSEVISQFDVARFLEFVKPVNIEFVNEFNSFCIDYIDNFSDVKIKPLLIKDLLDYIQRVIEALKDIKGANDIQYATINYFLGLYDDLIQLIRDRYESIYTDVFQENEDEPVKQILGENPFPRIFVGLDDKAYNIFDRLLLDFDIEEGKLYDFSFIYRMMKNDGYIHKEVGDSEIRVFLLDEFKIVINKTKTLKQCSTGNRREMYYSVVKST